MRQTLVLILVTALTPLGALWAKSMAYSFGGKTHIFIDTLVLLENNKIEIKAKKAGSAALKRLAVMKAPRRPNAAMKKRMRVKSTADFLARLKGERGQMFLAQQFQMTMVMKWLRNQKSVAGAYSEVIIFANGKEVEKVGVEVIDKKQLVSGLSVKVFQDPTFKHMEIAVHIPEKYKENIPCIYVGTSKRPRRYKMSNSCNIPSQPTEIDGKTFGRIPLFDRREGETIYYRLDFALSGGIVAATHKVKITHTVRAEPVLVNCEPKGKTMLIKWDKPRKQKLITKHQVLLKTSEQEKPTLLLDGVKSRVLSVKADLSKSKLGDGRVGLVVRTHYKGGSTADTFSDQCGGFAGEFK